MNEIEIKTTCPVVKKKGEMMRRQNERINE